jgi:hypothetical protein
VTILSLQAQTTQTAPFDSSPISVSGALSNGTPADWTISLDILALAPGTTVRFSVDDTVTSTYLSGPTFSLIGDAGHSYPRSLSIKKEDFPDLRVGATNAQLKFRLLNIGGVAPSVTYQARIVY